MILIRWPNSKVPRFLFYLSLIFSSMRQRERERFNVITIDTWWLLLFWFLLTMLRLMLFAIYVFVCVCVVCRHFNDKWMAWLNLQYEGYWTINIFWIVISHAHSFSLHHYSWYTMTTSKTPQSLTRYKKKLASAKKSIFKHKTQSMCALTLM